MKSRLKREELSESSIFHLKRCKARQKSEGSEGGHKAHRCINELGAAAFVPGGRLPAAGGAGRRALCGALGEGGRGAGRVPSALVLASWRQRAPENLLSFYR